MRYQGKMVVHDFVSWKWNGDHHVTWCLAIPRSWQDTDKKVKIPLCLCSCVPHAYLYRTFVLVLCQ